MSGNNSGIGMTKADLIVSKVEKLSQQTAAFDSRVAAAFRELKAGGSATAAAVKKLANAPQPEPTVKTDDINYLSVQIESVYSGLAKMVSNLTAEVEKLKRSGVGGGSAADADELSSRVAEKIIIPYQGSADIDYDLLAEKVSEITGTGGTINYDLLATKVATKLGLKLMGHLSIDYETLAERICDHISPTEGGAIDTDSLAEKLARALPPQEVISPDYIASKVAEQIVLPEPVATNATVANLDIEELSRKVADKIAIPVYDAPEVAVDEERIAEAVAEKLRAEDFAPAATQVVEEHENLIDEEALAEAISSRLNISLSDKMIADAVVRNLSEAIDNDEIADCVAKKVGTIAPEQFDVLVDDDGCDSLAKAVEDKLDYEVICAEVASRLAPAILEGSNDLDTEELAKALSEKMSVSATVNEDVLADKAAAILSNYLPDIDTDDIADKVVAGVLPAIPAAPVIDYDGISSSVSEKLVESQEDQDFDIVIDDEGLARITESVSDEIKKEYNERFDKIENDISVYNERFDKIEDDIREIKELLLSGTIVAAAVSETAATEAVYEEPYQEEVLVTVSDIVEEEPAVEEVVEEPAEEADEEEYEDDVIDEIVDDIDENLTDEEVMPDGIPEISGGVDFANMMKYNRSFIARIIQGSDDQKRYYGTVKNALLSYKKVNSNIAWGAERFNKGRETIARFKIRGKTLCLYLALDPNEFETSVYHHADVSDNKSMHGTPMMVKIKSPRGVKKAIRLIDAMLEQREGIKQNVQERDYAAMYPYETIDELIEDGLVKDVSKK